MKKIKKIIIYTANIILFCVILGILGYFFPKLFTNKLFMFFYAFVFSYVNICLYRYFQKHKDD